MADQFGFRHQKPAEKSEVLAPLGAAEDTAI
jgi:hypothetical protein